MSVEETVTRIRTGSTGWMIQRIARRLDEAMNARLSAHDLTIQQFAVLMRVLERDGQTQAEIGSHFGMPAYAISRALDHLEGTGRVVRAPHPTSRRSLTIHGTDAGKMLLPDLTAIIHAVNADLAAPLTDAERDTLNSLLNRLVS